MVDQKATELDFIASIIASDIFYVVDDPGGTPVSKKATFTQLSTFLASSFAPLAHSHTEDDIVKSAALLAPVVNVITVDFDLANELQVSVLSGDTSIVTTNRGAGKTKTVKIVSDSTQRDLTFSESWAFLRDIKPAFIPANTAAYLTLSCSGSTEAEVTAMYSEDTLGGKHIEGHLHVGNWGEIDESIDTILANFKEISTQVTDHMIGVSVVPNWAPDTNVNTRSYAVYDMYAQLSPATGVNIPFGTGFAAQVQNGINGRQGTIGAYRHFNVNLPVTADLAATGATFGDYFSFRADDQTPMDTYITGTKWGVYIDSGAGKNYFGANVGVGVETSLARLHVHSTTTDETPIQILQNDDGFISLYAHNGTPETAVNADPGALCSDFTNGKLYVKNTGAGTNTGWLDLSVGGGGSNALLDGTNHTDTVAQAVTRGSIIYGNATPAWDELPVGTVNQVLATDGTDAAWTTLAKTNLPSTVVHTDQQNIYGSDAQIFQTNAFAILNPGLTASYGFASAAIVTNKTISLPLLTANDTMLMEAHTQTLTNKTIDGDDNTIQDIAVSSLANGTDGQLITWDAAGAPATVATGTANQVLTSNGAGAAPTFQNNAAGFADPMTTRGDVIIRDATNTTARLGVGGAGEVLQSDGTDISWGTAGAGTWTDTSTSTGTNKTLDDASNEIHSDGVHINCRNNSGITLSKGDAVHTTGFDAGTGLPTIAIADADGSGTMPALGLVEDASITNNSNGLVCINGRASGFDTTFGSVGDAVYVSTVGTTGNTLTVTRPTGITAGVQKIGEILRSHATLGEMEVTGAGRTNDVPNLEDGKLWVGNGSNVATPVNLSGDVSIDNTGLATVSDDSHAHTSTTLTLASTDLTNTSVIPLTNIQNTYTDFQIYPTTRLVLGDLSLNHFYFFATSELTADRTVTMPLLTGNDTVVFENHTATLANKTLTTPTIASFANATHDHVDAAGGGTLDTTSFTAGSSMVESGIPFMIDGGGSAYTTGIKGLIVVPSDITITQCIVLNQASDTVQVDINRYTSIANYNAGTKASITASNPPATTAAKAADSGISGWTVTLNKGDILEFEVDTAGSTTTWTEVYLDYDKR